MKQKCKNVKKKEKIAGALPFMIRMNILEKGSLN